MLNSALDTLLDRTVVPGYSKLGYAVRRRFWAADPSPDALRGRTVAVTGANSGLGKAAALGAARLGADVRLLCRDADRGERARAELAGQVDAAFTVDRCDLSDPASVRACAAGLPAIDALVHNAGVLPPQRTENADGHELTLATHVLGPHLLTALLRPGRVVWVSSGGMYTQKLPIDDVEYQQGTYRGATAYARTKRMQVVLSEQWTEHGIASHAMHPGWAETPGISDSLPGFSKVLGPILRDADQGADTAVWLLAADVPPGRFWHDRRPGRHRTCRGRSRPRRRPGACGTSASRRPPRRSSRELSALRAVGTRRGADNSQSTGSQVLGSASVGDTSAAAASACAWSAETASCWP